MVSSNVLNDINALQIEQQAVVLSLIKSFIKQQERRTQAQIRFEEDCKRYDERQPLSMSEIDDIIHKG